MSQVLLGSFIPLNYRINFTYYHATIAAALPSSSSFSIHITHTHFAFYF